MRITFIVAALALLVPHAALAWGPEGHAIVARIAADHLSARAKHAVGDLLGAPAADRMAAVSSWADWQGHAEPWTKPWHYVDIEIDSAGYDAARDCAGGNCVVAQIGRDEAVLADPAAARGDRVLALKWLIHLVGDLHQPLHCADDHDRGGNQVPVALDGTETNLHRVWDSDEVMQLGYQAQATATLEAAITRADIRSWQRGTPQDWANESFVIAKDRIYPRVARNGVTVMSGATLAADKPVVAQQLEKAGVRLAGLLNRTLR